MGEIQQPDSNELRSEMGIRAMLRFRHQNLSAADSRLKLPDKMTICRKHTAVISGMNSSDAASVIRPIGGQTIIVTARDIAA